MKKKAQPKKTTTTRTKAKTRTSAPQFYPLGQVPPGFFHYNWRDPNDKAAVTSPEQALTLSPFYAGLRLYQGSTGLLPLVTYRRTDDGRERARTHPAYKLLAERPNPAQDRATFFEWAIRDYFTAGNFFAEVIWSGNNQPVALYPIPSCAVTRIDLGSDWTKTYTIQTMNGVRTVQHEDMIHVVGPVSRDGLVGISFLEYAAESLGLHRQVLQAATSFFQNAARPQVYVSFPGNPSQAAKDANKKEWKEKYSGARNTGETAVMYGGMTINAFPGAPNAEDGKYIEALTSSVADISRWFSVSPLTLGDLTRGTYGNAGADNLAFYQKSLAPVLNKFELAINYTLFGADASLYSEFLTQKILAADPTAQSVIWAAGIQAGYYLRSEVREWQNLPFIKGTDQPLAPMNMGGPAGNQAPAKSQQLEVQDDALNPDPDSN